MAAISAAAQEDDELEAELRRGEPGLVAIYEANRAVATIADRLAFRYELGESPHPQLTDGEWSARFTGRLYCVRPGKYSFRVEPATARARLDLAGQTAIDSTREGNVVAATIELPYGPVELAAEFHAPAEDVAWLNLSWSKDGEPFEPVPAGVLEHTDAHLTDQVRSLLSIETGRRAFADRRCVSCHVSNAANGVDVGLPSDRAPILTSIGSRVRAAWLHHWLDRPRDIRPTSTMPKLFGESAAERVDLFAVAQYLANERAADAPPIATLDSLPANATTAAETHAPAKRLFAERGCVACHLAPEEANEDFPQLVSLTGLGSKTDATRLAEWIGEPARFHPDTRMPDFDFERSEPEIIEPLARYLAVSRDRAWEGLPPAPTNDAVVARLHALSPTEGLPAALAGDDSSRLRALGRVAIETRGCLNCHELGDLKPGQPNAPTLSELARRAKPAAPASIEGCLGEADGAPNHALDMATREALAAFLRDGTSMAAAAHADPRLATLHTLNHRLDRLGCVACHRRNGSGGVFADRVLDFVELGSDQTLLDVAPPDLSAVGEKLRSSAIERILSGEVRARPWMAAKMPHFAPARAAGLADLLVRAEGLETPKVDTSSKTAKVPKSAFVGEVESIGRLLVGRTGLNCVSCHDIRGVKSLGVRGPDLAHVAERVNRAWFERWLLDPQRVTPGTRMPTVFFGGRSAAPQFVGGDPTAQIDALWAYLSQGDRLELPIMAAGAAVAVEGGENPRFTPEGRPIVVRGFMPGHAGMRGIALGFPAGVHFAFDSETCLITEAWRGDFVEVGGWYGAGRGSAEENGVKVLGEIFWRFPDRQVAIVPANANDDLADELRAVASTAVAVRHRAVWTSAADAGFEYEVASADGQRVVVTDRPHAIANKVENEIKTSGFSRSLRFRGFALGSSIWIRVANLEGDDVKIDVHASLGEPVPYLEGGERIVSREAISSERLAFDDDGIVREVGLQASSFAAQWVREGTNLWLRVEADGSECEAMLSYSLR